MNKYKFFLIHTLITFLYNRPQNIITDWKLRGEDFENSIVNILIESIKIARPISPPCDTNFKYLKSCV